MSQEVEYDLAGNPIERFVSSEAFDGDEDISSKEPLSIADQVEEVSAEAFGDLLDQHFDENSDVSLESIEDSITRYRGEVELLNNLYHTVSQEGVSQEDIRTLKSIQERIFGSGNVPAGIGIEEFDEYLFTEERSSVSISVANESFLATMVQTVKDWIRKIVEFIGRMIEWVAKNIWSEQRFKSQMSVGVKRYDLARDARVKAEVLVGTQAKTKPIMIKYANELLKSDRLQINLATVAAFGDRQVSREIDELALHTRAASQKLAEELSVLKRDLEDGTGKVNVTMFPLNALETLAERSGKLVERQPANSFLAQKVKLSIFDSEIPTLTKTVTPFEDVAKQYSAMRSTFKSVKRVSNEKKITYLVDYMNKVMKAVTDMGRILSAIRDINNIKLQVISVFINYENHYANLIMKIVKSDIDDGFKRGKIDEIFENARANMGTFK